MCKDVHILSDVLNDYAFNFQAKQESVSKTWPILDRVFSCVEKRKKIFELNALSETAKRASSEESPKTISESNSISIHYRRISCHIYILQSVFHDYQHSYSTTFLLLL